MTDAPLYLLPLQQLTDSALPTGAFSHSFGLETYLERGLVHDEPGLADWLGQFIRIQLTHSDGYAIRLAVEGSSRQELYRLDRMVTAQALPREIREAGIKMGARMLAIASQVAPCAELDAYAAEIAAGRCAGHPALAFAVAGKKLQVPLAQLLSGYLFSTITSLTLNAVRGIPIGQNAGQRVLIGAQQEVRAAVQHIMRLEPDDFGAAAPALEIAQMRHERQRARMFMS